MESITHNLSAILIQILCFNFFMYPMNFILTIFIAFLSHFLSDALSKITYHTPKAMKKDKFWVIWHVIIYSASIIVAVIFLIPFWLALLSVNIPDVIDWFIIRPLNNRKRGKSSEVGEEKNYRLHRIADWIRSKLLFWLPDLTYKKVGIITELITIGILSFLIWLFI
ncbi:MAG: hypothetical protein ACFE9S_14235 [Candidatus Hermodarchaeota archaeon]